MFPKDRKPASRFVVLVGILLFLLLLASSGVAWGGDAEAQTVFTATRTASHTPTTTWTPSITPTVTTTATVTPTPSETPIPSPTTGVTPLLLTPEPTLPPIATPTPAAPSSALGSILPWLILIGLLVLIGGGVVAFLVLHRRSESEL
jgi:hypothetical protein